MRRQASGFRLQAVETALLLGLAMLPLAACSDGGSTTPETIVGGWVLTSIEGDPVPVVIYAVPGDTITLVDGWLAIEPGGQYELRVRETFSWTPDTVDFDHSGAWERDGESLVLTEVPYSEDSPVTLTIDDGALLHQSLLGEMRWERETNE